MAGSCLTTELAREPARRSISTWRTWLQRAAQLLGVGLCLFAITAWAGTASYYYDELGRLVETVAADGTSVLYSYDPVGNITVVKHNSATTVGVSGFTPNVGPVGTVVTIFGSGFNSVAANNVVKFNGTAATVSSATATTLTVAVPAGATTGTVSVTNGAASATSSGSFTVAASGAPTISAFSPTVGSQGTAVTISGTNFQTSAATDKVMFGGTIAAISSVTSTTIGTSDPAPAASGKISVTTPFGVATSTADFFALPAGFSVSDVQFTGRISLGGAPLTVSTTTTSKTAVVLFDGVAGAIGTYLQLASVTSASGTMSVYGPGGNLFASIPIGNAQLSLPALPTTGTYTVVLAPIAPVSLSISLNQPTSVTVDGAPLSITSSGTGYGAYLVFNGSAGQNLGLALTGLSVSLGSAGSANMYVYAPSGTLLQSVNCLVSNPGGGCSLSLSNLPQTGKYLISVLNGSASNPALSGTITLSSDKAAALTAGTAYPLSLRAGQNGRLTFAGTAGQPATIRWENIVTTPANQNVTVTILKPDNTTLATAVGTSATNGNELYVASLPTTGTYKVIATTAYGAATTTSVTLNPAPELVVDGAAVNFTSAGAGLGTSMTFNGTAGQNLGLGLTGVSVALGSAGSVNVYVYGPSGGGALWQVNCLISNASGDCAVALPSLPTTGTYLVVVANSPGQGVATGTITLSSDKVAALTAGTVYPLSLRAGQNGRLTFAGTAGQPATIRWENIVTTPANQNVTVTILKPDNTTLATAVGASATNGNELYVASLPTTGTYKVIATTAYGAATTTSVTLNPAPELVVDGAAVNFTSAGAGLGTSMTFNGTAGQNLGLGLTGVSVALGSAGSVNVYVYGPSGGGALWQVNCLISNASGDCAVALPSLPTTGTYLVVVANSPGQGVATGTMTLSSDKAGTLTSGTAYSLSLRSGQNGRLTFAGTAGQPSPLRYENIVTNPANLNVAVTILKPDGTALTTVSNGSSATNGNLVFVPSLPSTGTYTVLVTSAYGAATTASLTLNPAPELVVDGSSVNITSAATSYGTSLTFNGTAGQNLGLGLSGLSEAGASNSAVTLNVYGPSGTVLWSVYCVQSNASGACSLPLANLPQTGTYLIGVANNSGSPPIATGTLTLSSDKVATLTSGTAYPLSLRSGQNGRLTFAGTAGQPTTIRWENITTTPANQNVAVTILKPDGTTLTTAVNGSSSSNGNMVYVASLPSTGTYTVLVTSAYGAATTASLTLNPAPELVVDGSSVNITSAATSYGTSLTFNGTAGQNLGLGLSGLSEVGASNSAVTLNVYGPSGTVLWSVYCVQSNASGFCGLALPNLPQTGTYLIGVANNSGSPAIATGALTLSSDKVATLTSGAAYSLSLRSGQNGRLTFAGTAAPHTLTVGIPSTVPSNQTVSVSVVDASNSKVASGSFSTAGGALTLGTLTAGIYTVLVSTSYGAATSMTLTYQ